MNESDAGCFLKCWAVGMYILKVRRNFVESLMKILLNWIWMRWMRTGIIITELVYFNHTVWKNLHFLLIYRHGVCTRNWVCLVSFNKYCILFNIDIASAAFAPRFMQSHFLSHVVLSDSEEQLKNSMTCPRLMCLSEIYSWHTKVVWWSEECVLAKSTHTVCTFQIVGYYPFYLVFTIHLWCWSSECFRWRLIVCKTEHV
jgi:hypothetical protein